MKFNRIKIYKNIDNIQFLFYINRWYYILLIIDKPNKDHTLINILPKLSYEKLKIYSSKIYMQTHYNIELSFLIFSISLDYYK